MLAPFYNVSKTYIDSFRLNDWVIYGSSRLGTQQASKPLVSVKFTANQTNGLLSNQQWLYVNDESELILDSFVLMRGQKAYELTNHLGNVLTTVSDKKVAVCTNGTFSHFGADVLSATDYSPFGAPLPGRNWQQLKPDAIAVNLPQGNITATTGWTTMFCSNPTTCISPEPSVTLSAVGGKLRMQTNKRYAQAYYTIATIPGRVYKIRYRLSGVTFSFTNISVFAPTSRVDLYVAPNLTPAAVNGIDQEVTFTATEGTTRFYLTRGWAATATTPTIETLFLDYLTIAEDWNYRFGFNGMEKDDEIKGVENSYDYGARIYDPRLGKWLSLDPLQAKYPNLSPYNYTANSPLIYRDVDGKDYELVIDHKTKTITIVATYYVPEGDAEAKAAASAGVAVWNAASGVYEYKVGDETYTINFSLSVKEVKDPIAAANADASGNSYVISDLLVKPGEKEGEMHNGNTTDGKHIAVRRSRAEATDPHEIGHSLGLGHFYKGFMSALAGVFRTSMKVTKGNVMEILKDSNIGSKPMPIDGEDEKTKDRRDPPKAKFFKTEDVSKRPSNFENGEVERSDGNNNYIDY